MTDTYMVITDQSNTVLAGETQQPVFDPYTKTSIVKPIEITMFSGLTEQTFSFESGAGSGKIVFNPFSITKKVDVTSQPTFLAHASGVFWKFVDILFVKPTGGASTNPLRPYLSYRLGTVGISEITTADSEDEGIIETVSFVFGQLQIGYQMQKPDGSYFPFAPVGWDRIRNIKI